MLWKYPWDRTDNTWAPVAPVSSRAQQMRQTCCPRHSIRVNCVREGVLLHFRDLIIKPGFNSNAVLKCGDRHTSTPLRLARHLRLNLAQVSLEVLVKSRFPALLLLQLDASIGFTRKKTRVIWLPESSNPANMHILVYLWFGPRGLQEHRTVDAHMVSGCTRELLLVFTSVFLNSKIPVILQLYRNVNN